MLVRVIYNTSTKKVKAVFEHKTNTITSFQELNTKGEQRLILCEEMKVIYPLLQGQGYDMTMFDNFLKYRNIEIR